MADQCFLGVDKRELNRWEPSVTVKLLGFEVRIGPEPRFPPDGGNGDWGNPVLSARLFTAYESSTNGGMRQAGVEPIIFESVDELGPFIERMLATGELPEIWMKEGGHA